MLDSPHSVRSYERLNRKAAKVWSTLVYHLTDLHGRPMYDVQALHPDFKHGERHPRDVPRLVLLKGPSVLDEGSWFTLGPPAARGNDVISLVEFLSGGAPRSVCASYLQSLVDRFCEVELVR